jgi:hypothetical protein
MVFFPGHHHDNLHKSYEYDQSLSALKQPLIGSSTISRRCSKVRNRTSIAQVSKESDRERNNGLTCNRMLLQLIIRYCLDLVQIGAADWYLNPEFKVLLKPIIDILLPTLQLSFHTSMLAALASDTPPTIAFFLGLPAPERKSWDVYVLVFVDPDGDHHLYIGSGTEANAGITGRTAVYANKTHPRLPRFVRLAFDRGYELVHIGTLCWVPLPQPAQVPRARLLFLCLEAVFTCIFYACFRTVMEPLWSDLMPWTRDSVSWSPLNSHLSLSEGVGDSLNLSAEQLQAVSDLRKERTRVTMAHASKAQYDREREKDLEAHLARKRKDKALWAARNKERVAVMPKPLPKPYPPAVSYAMTAIYLWLPQVP